MQAGPIRALAGSLHLGVESDDAATMGPDAIVRDGGYPNSAIGGSFDDHVVHATAKPGCNPELVCFMARSMPNR